jgi:hypothetical protein
VRDLEANARRIKFAELRNHVGRSAPAVGAKCCSRNLLEVALRQTVKFECEFWSSGRR